MRLGKFTSGESKYPLFWGDEAAIAAIELICYCPLPLYFIRLFAKPFRDYRSRMDPCAARRDIVKPADSAILYSSTRFCTRIRAAASKLPREKVHPSRTKSARAFIVHPRQLPMRYVPFFIRHRHTHTHRCEGEADEVKQTKLTNARSKHAKPFRNGAARYQTNGPDVIF